MAAMDMLPASQNNIASRYSYLLQPIRDLVKNWEVDLASDLEDYLVELDRMAISFDHGVTTINFAEAALFIQGSALVYSRKVEYLYNLVCEVLATIGGTKKQQEEKEKKKSAGKENKSALDWPDWGDDEEDEFLSLDDIPEDPNITMKEDIDSHGRKINKVVPLTPWVLLPRDNDRAPLISMNGEVVGNRNDFWMNTAHIAPTGALVYDSAHLSLVTPRAAPHVNNMSPPQAAPAPDINPVNDQIGAVAAIDVDILGQVDPTLFDDDNGADDDRCAQGLATDKQKNVDKEHILEDDKKTTDKEDVEKSGMKTRNGKKEKAAKGKKAEKSDEIEEVVIDMNRLREFWRGLDPYEPSKPTAVRPLKKGRTFRLPAHGIGHSVAAGKKLMKRRRSGKGGKRSAAEVNSHLGEIPLNPFQDFYDDTYFPHLTKNPNKLILHTFEFNDFKRVYWAVVRRKKELARKKKLANKEAMNDEKEENKENLDDDCDSNEQIRANEDNDDNFAGDIDNDGPLSDDLEQLIIDGQNAYGLSPPCNNLEQGAATNSAPAVPVMTYEELVRQHTEQFMASAENHIQDTEINRRVMEWEERIVPRLQEEEQRVVFDIHDYGSRVLAALARLGGDDHKRVPFRRIVEGLKPFEVCRYFLATLQLANTYNVELEKKGTVDEAMDKATVKLLSLRRVHEEMENFRAPSHLNNNHSPSQPNRCAVPRTPTQSDHPSSPEPDDSASFRVPSRPIAKSRRVPKKTRAN